MNDSVSSMHKSDGTYILALDYWKLPAMQQTAVTWKKSGGISVGSVPAFVAAAAVVLTTMADDKFTTWRMTKYEMRFEMCSHTHTHDPESEALHSHGGPLMSVHVTTYLGNKSYYSFIICRRPTAARRIVLVQKKREIHCTSMPETCNPREEVISWNCGCKQHPKYCPSICTFSVSIIRYLFREKSSMNVFSSKWLFSYCIHYKHRRIIYENNSSETIYNMCRLIYSLKINLKNPKKYYRQTQ